MANQEVTPSILMEKYIEAEAELKDHPTTQATEAAVAQINLEDGRIVKVVVRLETVYQMF
jgi:hypothetical protein